jgi:hypothetical protein
LSKKYNKLWVFGDSFSTPDFCVEPQKSFWGLSAQALKIPTIINCSYAGQSFDSVRHMLVHQRDQYSWNDDLFLIGIPPLERLTFNLEIGSKVTTYGQRYELPNWTHDKFEIACHYGLTQDLDLCARVMAHYESRPWLEVQAMTEIFLLTAWLDSVNANYLIINLSHDFDFSNSWSTAEQAINYCKNHNRCMLRDDTYQSINRDINKPADYDQFGWSGHHGPAGNEYFFERSLWPRMLKCNLI